MKLSGICFKQIYSTLNKTIVPHITQYKSYFYIIQSIYQSVIFILVLLVNKLYLLHVSPNVMICYLYIGEWHKNQRLWLCSDYSTNHRSSEQSASDHQSKPNHKVIQSGYQEIHWYPALQRLQIPRRGESVRKLQCFLKCK